MFVYFRFPKKSFCLAQGKSERMWGFVLSFKYFNEIVVFIMTFIFVFFLFWKMVTQKTKVYILFSFYFLAFNHFPKVLHSFI